MDDTFDLIVIGGGIIGLATAMTLSKSYPELKLAIMEKESDLAHHQTGHNSGVIHSGLYYRPGSLKASLCVLGAQRLVQFCQNNSVPFELCGKLVMATEPEEIPRLQELQRRGTANGVPGLRMIGPAEAREFEPHARCLQALHAPTTGIVNFREVAQAYAERFVSSGGRIFLGHHVKAIEDHPYGAHITTGKGAFSSRFLVNCAGLYADRVAAMSGISVPCQIVPFRGEYYRIKPERHHLVRGLIYPVPDPRFPFLGVHFTRLIGGGIEAGPNAVLAWAREGYQKSDVVWDELTEILKYKGFWHLALRYWSPGWKEMVRSYSRSRFAEALQKLVPEICREDLSPGGSGVRAQALANDGSLLDDFVVLQKGHMLHVLNAPSPAATSSLAIAEYLVEIMSGLLRE